MMENIAIGKTCEQSSTYPGDYACGNAVDDNTSTRQFTQTNPNEWWKVDLGDSYNISEIQMYKGSGFGSFPSIFYIQTADDWAFTTNVTNIITCTNCSAESITWDTDDFGSVSTRYLRVITHTSSQYIGMAEFRVYGSSAASENIEDASLDLSVYGKRLEDFQSFLRAHDGLELHDLETVLEAFGLSMDDFPASLIAALQSIGDLGTGFEAWATRYRDLVGNFDAKGQRIENLPSWLETAKAGYRNLASYLAATDGVVEQSLVACLAASDGLSMRDFGLYLKAIRSVPAFRSITAQRVSSVVHEVS